MKALFAPATALMDRLRYTQKLLLIVVVVAIAIVLLLSTIYARLNQEILVAQQEISGLQMLKPANRVVQFMQQHRGMSFGFLNGDSTMRAPLAEKEKQVSHALAETDAVLSRELRESNEWKNIRTTWEELRSQGLGLQPAENLRRHTELISGNLEFMVDIADKSGLTLDSSESSYYLIDTIVTKLPRLLEPLGISRAQGTGILASRQLTQERRSSLTVLIERITSSLHDGNHNIKKVVKSVPELDAKLIGPINEFSAEVNEIFKLLQDDVFSEKFETQPKAYFALTTKVIDDGYKMMFETLFPHLEAQLNIRLEKSRMTMLMNIGSGLFVFLLVCYLFGGTYHSVIGGVQVLSKGAHSLAQGDLTTRFKTQGNDELQIAGQNFDNMAASIQNLIGEIQNEVTELRATAGALAASSEKISASANLQSQSASSMAASVEEMTGGIAHVAKNAEDAQERSRESDVVASQGVGIVSDVVAQIRGIAETVNQSAQTIEALNEQSGQISTIVGAIREISDQTNLLALNAAIEAARAGESGRGFAVVADEVRKLAERTGSATQEIASMISAIQGSTAGAVASMDSGVRSVGRSVEQARRAGEAIAQIQSRSRMVADAVAGISTALSEQTRASSGIAQSVEHIARMAGENNACARGNADTADKLRQFAETLSDHIQHFKTCSAEVQT
jgi:methyl-accepting chemotaxis protein